MIGQLNIEVTAPSLMLIILVLNTLALLVMIYRERKNVYSVMVWALFFILAPVVGFVFYIFIGQGPSLSKRKKYLAKLSNDKKLNKLMLQSYSDFKEELKDKYSDVEDEILFNINYNGAACAIHNDVKMYVDIALQYEELINDINNAKEFINIQYFIYQKDKVGTRIRDALVAKAREGVRVKLIVDDIGSMFSDTKFFQPIVDAGGEFIRFLSGWMYFNRNINYRNHRKIVVIDGCIAYTGGANIGDEYANNSKRKLPWRDTHMRLVGDVVSLLNLRFLQDYAFSTTKDVSNQDLTIAKHSVEKILPMQLISSGPDTLNEEIKQTYMKLIYSAKKRIWIQTPYYIPDDAFAESVKVAVEAGVDVRVMIPMYPDKKMVYMATHSFVSDLVRLGAKVYMHPTFIHSKTLLIDDEIVSVGTFNIDVRSFKLHFEHTMLMYGLEINEENRKIFMQDMKISQQIDEKFLLDKKFGRRFMEGTMRLFSPLF